MTDPTKFDRASDPIDILDEIERDLNDLQVPGVDKMLLERKLKSLREAIVQMQDEHRTALEAQAEELSSRESELDRALDTIHDLEQTQCVKSLREAREELAQKDARIARLEHGLNDTVDFLRISTNSSPEQKLADKIDKLLNESPAQSLAVIKAEVLREFGAYIRRKASGRVGTIKYYRDMAYEEADRIEQEASCCSDKADECEAKEGS